MEGYSLQIDGKERNFLFFEFLPENKELNIIVDILIGRHKLSDFFLQPTGLSGSPVDIGVMAGNIPSKENYKLRSVENWIENYLNKAMPDGYMAGLSAPVIFKSGLLPEIGSVYIFFIVLMEIYNSITIFSGNSKITLLGYN